MTTFTMINFSTGKTVHKTQKTEPKMRGFTCVSRQTVLPSMLKTGAQLFRDANDNAYYAHVNSEGFHSQP